MKLYKKILIVSLLLTECQNNVSNSVSISSESINSIIDDTSSNSFVTSSSYTRPVITTYEDKVKTEVNLHFYLCGEYKGTKTEQIGISQSKYGIYDYPVPYLYQAGDLSWNDSVLYTSYYEDEESSIPLDEIKLRNRLVNDIYIQTEELYKVYHKGMFDGTYYGYEAGHKDIDNYNEDFLVEIKDDILHIEDKVNNIVVEGKIECEEERNYYQLYFSDFKINGNEDSNFTYRIYYKGNYVFSGNKIYIQIDAKDFSDGYSCFLSQKKDFN